MSQATTMTQRHPYSPALYRYNKTVTGVKHFHDIDDDAVARFRRDGFLVIEEAFTQEQVQDTLDGLMALAQGRNPAFKDIEFEAAVHDRLDQMSPEEKLNHIRKLMRFSEAEPRLKAFVTHPQILAAVSRVMGHDRPQVFQEMALVKLPGGREKPWHQDHAYFDIPLDSPVVGTWTALDDATPENGCMRFVPGSHRLGPQLHFKIRDWQICDTQVGRFDVVAAPVRAGGCILFDGMTLHGTPHNATGQSRRAVQIHYAPQGVAMDSAFEGERLQAFGSEGKDVTC